ncbi:peptidylprolyl isomerase [Acidaminobacter sp. JC074]|uniref:peptidylprolyl isomerase n=1 Tax=Acidaminobacter sp. JC074 TaxID=2530199 RepID=UPI001F105A7F|nr:peptidylprolyl isomerase [Acidaminobacter sp. JC074]MCH4890408.1 peptidylprolyl isomerase [Acidaminobacter sp. JC074]
MENKVLALVGDREIRQSDFDTLLQQIGPQRAMQFQSEEGQKQLLDELIHQELFLIDGKENKLDETEEFVQELEFVKENMIKQFAIRTLLDSVKVEDKEIEDFYGQNAAMFSNPESVTASHILVDTEEKANVILEELKGDKSFEDAAKEYSSCPSSQNGGDLGNFTRGRMVPEFENAAFAMDVNEVSGVVPTQFGFHIIKVTDKQEASQKTLEEAKEEIANTVLLQKQQQVYLAKVDEIKKNVTVEVK